MITFTNRSFTTTYAIHSVNDNYLSPKNALKTINTTKKFKIKHTPSNYINPDSYFNDNLDTPFNLSLILT